jgi:excisionase family DNA binding protein
MSEPMFLTREEAAREANVSLDTIRRAINKGDLRAKRTGWDDEKKVATGKYLIDRAALREWFDGLVDA